jgi:broad specificity phosphatase PhoE
MTRPVRLYLIRHGQASAGFAEALDPGLDEIGQAQAQAVAQELALLGPLPVVTSPLRRARETAAAFESLWGVQARVEPAVAEIPTPTMDLQARIAWLRRAMHGRWGDLPAAYQEWRSQVVACLVALGTSAVVTTHFVAINVAVGAATDDDRMVCCEPDHCSCTVLEVVDGRLRVVTLGRQRATQIR